MCDHAHSHCMDTPTVNAWIRPLETAAGLVVYTEIINTTTACIYKLNYLLSLFPLQIVTVVQNLQTGGAGPLSPLTPSDQRVPILGPNFPDYVRTLHCNSDHLFAEEYELIGIKSPSLSHQHSQLPWNTGKNRYANINSCE